MIFEEEKNSRECCPICGRYGMKSWSELNSEEKMTAERIPHLSGLNQQRREMSKICPKCWHLATNSEQISA